MHNLLWAVHEFENVAVIDVGLRLFRDVLLASVLIELKRIVIWISSEFKHLCTLK